jgi:hypothetical protein
MDILNRDQIEDFLNASFKQILSGSPFLQEENYASSFKYSTNERVDFVTYTNINVYQQFFCTKPILQRYITSVEKYWIDMASQINIQPGRYFATISLQPVILKPGIVTESNYDRVYHGYRAVSDKAGIDVFVKIVAEIINNVLFPASKQYLDLREIDKFVNAEIKYRDHVQGFLGTEGTQFKRLIIAKLAGNPIYDDLVTHYRGHYDWYTNKAKEPGSAYWGNYPNVFESLFDRLKKVEPLKNPVVS